MKTQIFRLSGLGPSETPVQVMDTKRQLDRFISKRVHWEDSYRVMAAVQDSIRRRRSEMIQIDFEIRWGETTLVKIVRGCWLSLSPISRSECGRTREFLTGTREWTFVRRRNSRGDGQQTSSSSWLALMSSSWRTHLLAMKGGRRDTTAPTCTCVCVYGTQKST